MIGLLSFLALAGFGLGKAKLDDSNLGKAKQSSAKLDNPKLDESNRHQRLCKDRTIIADPNFYPFTP